MNASGAAHVLGLTVEGISGSPTGSVVVPSLFVARLSPAGSALDHLRYVQGASTGSVGGGIALDASGAAWVTGQSLPSRPFGTRDPFDGSPNGDTDVIVARLAPGGELLYGTYLGGAGADYGLAVAVDGAGAAYVSGVTGSSGFPTSPGALDATLGGSQDVFVTRFDPGSPPPPPPPPPVPNHLDADTATLEGSAGRWAPWYSTTVRRSASDEPYRGASPSLRVEVTQPHGWGVALSNAPGFPATPGAKRLSFRGYDPGNGQVGADLTVEWRDAAGRLLQTDVVSIESLGTVWEFVQALVNAPAGTAFVFATISNPEGVAGDTLYFDDISIQPVRNALDLDTSSIEGSTGAWVPWFSTAISRSSERANSGRHSLRIDVTQPYGWGVTLGNWPGFATGPGPKTIGFSASAPLGSQLNAKMRVTWFDAARNPLGTVEVSNPSVPSGWQTSYAYRDVRVGRISTFGAVIAPAGTATAQVDITGGLGGPGDRLYVDDVFVVDGDLGLYLPTPPRANNALDAATATLESSLGQWAPWFSSSLSRPFGGHGGSRSLRVTVTGPYGWGVTLRNHPGFAATPGPKTLSFWARNVAGPGRPVTMQVSWRAGDGTLLRTDSVWSPALGPDWQQAAADVVAPPGTERVSVAFYGDGSAGDVVDLDDITIADRPG